MRWLVIGTAPTAPASLELLAGEQWAGVATCNGGLGLWPTPDVYLAIDQVAAGMHAAAARAAQKRGTRLVTREEPSQRHYELKGVDFYDEFIAIGKEPPVRGGLMAERWGPGGLTGPLVLEYALRAGASEVAIIGCDGYRWKGDYWPGHPELTCTRGDATGLSRRVLGPGYAMRAEAWPEVPVIQYGRPVFRVALPNWEVRDVG